MSISPLFRYSIKERLNSVNRPTQREDSISRQPISQSKIYEPEQYNYFLNAIDKEISHENNIYKRIKSKISSLRKFQTSKVQIKNSYLFNHKNFSSKTLKKHHQKGRFQKSQTNHIFNAKQNQSSFRGYDQDVSNYKKCLGFSTTSAQTTPYFVRSNLNTPHTISQFFSENVQTKLHEISRRIQKQLSKQKVSEKQINNLNIVGSEPQWRDFQCYHRGKNRYSGIVSR